MKMKKLVVALGAAGIGMFAVANLAGAATCRDFYGTALEVTSNCLVNTSQGCYGGSCSCEGDLGGFPSADVIVGSDGPNVIYAGGGDDIIVSLKGSDVICAGDGNDFVDAGRTGEPPAPPKNAPEVVRANQIRLGPGNDTAVTGGRGEKPWLFKSVMWAGQGNDAVVGGNGQDWLSGDDGNDFITGGAGDDQLYGGAGNDFLSGQEGADRLDGGDPPVNLLDICVGGNDGDAAIYCGRVVSIP